MRYNWHLSWALASFFGWLLSFPFNGPVLQVAGPETLSNLPLSAYFIIFHALGLLVLAILPPERLNLQKYMSSGATICLVVSSLFFSLDITKYLWAGAACFAIMGVASSIFVLGWALPYTRLIAGSERIKFMALVILKSNIICLAFNLSVFRINEWFVFTGLFITLGVSILASKQIPLHENESSLNSPATPGGAFEGKGFLLLLCFFVLGIYLNGGLMYDIIYPSFENISLYFRNIPYILVLLVIILQYRRISGQFAIYTGASLLGLAFISFAVLSDSMPGFFITGSLVEAAFAFIDIFIWITLAKIALFYSHPYRVFGFGLFANVAAILAGGISGNFLLQLEGSHFVLTGLFAAGAIFLTFLIIPWLLRRVDEGTARYYDMLTAKEQIQNMVDSLPDADSLTPREKEIAEQLLQGATNKKTAASLLISENTLKTHIRNIYRKIGVTQKRELLSLALENKNIPDKENRST